MRFAGGIDGSAMGGASQRAMAKAGEYGHEAHAAFPRRRAVQGERPWGAIA